MLSTTIFTVNSTETSMSMAGNLDFEGVIIKLSPQAAGSLTAHYSGTVSADVTGTSITFTGGSNITAIATGKYNPGGTAADYAGQGGASIFGFSVSGIAAIRGLIGNLTSKAIPITSSGSFNSTPLSFSSKAGTIAYTIDSPLGDDSGTQSVNSKSSGADLAPASSYVVEGGVATLTVPIDATLKFNTSVGVITGVFTGKLVATAGKVIPPPPTGTISGEAYLDVTKSGKTTETGIDDVSIMLDNSSGKLVQTVKTNSKGDYSISGLALGTYRTFEVVPKGDKLVNPPKAGYVEVTLTASSLTDVIDFANLAS